MSIHKLTPAAVTRAVRQAYLAAVWNAVALLVGALFLIWKLESRWTVLFGIGPIILMMVWNSMRRAEAVYRAYEIEMDEQAFVRAVVVEAREDELDLAAGNRDAKVVGGDGFDGMGLIQHGDVVVGQDADALPPQGEVAEE